MTDESVVNDLSWWNWMEARWREILLLRLFSTSEHSMWPKTNWLSSQADQCGRQWAEMLHNVNRFALRKDVKVYSRMFSLVAPGGHCSHCGILCWRGLILLEYRAPSIPLTSFTNLPCLKNGARRMEYSPNDWAYGWHTPLISSHFLHVIVKTWMKWNIRE